MEGHSKLLNPFPGLRPFGSDENHLFFGREDQSQELLKKLKRKRFLGVVGTSGCGKSSLVRAGLLPALHGGFMTQAGSRWRIAVFRPGHDPIGNMARALDAPEVFGAAKAEVVDRATIIEITLRRSDLGLAEATRQARLPEHDNVLIVVDQFEELLRFEQAKEADGNPDEASAFVALLLEAAKNEKIPIYIVLTMRSDFLGDCSQFRDLPEVMNEGQYLVPRMTRSQRQMAITGPIAVGGGEITPGLVQQLLNDVGDNPDQLPILQHALMRTWDNWMQNGHNSGPIDQQCYDNVGGMNRALSLHADEAYEDLSDDRSKKIAEILFKTLCERGADNREIRRPTRLGQICAIAEADEKEVIIVINSFRKHGRSFLMPPRDVALTKEALIDISHESLIRNWLLLKNWVDEEAQSALIYKRLAETAFLFKKKKAGFWRDPDLQIALNWQNETRPNESWGKQYYPEYNGAIEFLEASKANRDAELSEIETARDRELQQAQELAIERGKAAKRLRFTMILLTIVLFVAGFAIISFTQRQMAIQKADTAEKEKQISELEKLKSDSSAFAFATLFNKSDSLRQVEQRVRLEVEKQRKLAIIARNSAASERERAEAQTIIAEELRDKAITARDTALKSQRQVLAVALAIKSERLRLLGSDTLSALLALESYHFDESSGGQFHNEVYDALRKSLNTITPDLGGPIEILTPADLITSMDFDFNSGTIAVGGADGKIHLFTISQPNQTQFAGSHKGMVSAIALSRNGHFLASGGADKFIMIWDFHKGSDNSRILGSHHSRIWSIAINPDDNLIASGSTDGVIKLWNLQENTTDQIISKLDGNIMALAFSNHDKTLAAGTSLNKVYLWKLEDTNQTGIDSIQFDSSPRTISFSGDDSQMAVGLENGSVILVHLPGNDIQILRGHQKRVNSVAFSPNDKLLASGSSDKTVRLWNLQHLSIDPIVLSKEESSIREVSFTATGDSLVCSTFGKNILLWKINSSEFVRLLRNRIQRNLTLEERHAYIGSENENP